MERVLIEGENFLYVDESADFGRGMVGANEYRPVTAAAAILEMEHKRNAYIREVTRG